MATQHWIMGVFFLTSVFQVAHASWWYLGVASSYQVISEEVMHEPDNSCDHLDYLGARQKEICNRDRYIIDVVSNGASTAIEECQHQFSNRRWNCSTYNNTSVFGQVLQMKSRETAYIYGILSAGITYAVTRACAKGELQSCGCDNKIRKFPQPDFKWGGCSENVRYGFKFSKQFLDSDEASEEDKRSMNLWNNGAGRKTIRDSMDRKCKCHGVSGDCSVKICWKKMQSFRMIGAHLKKKFDDATFVRWDPKKEKLKRITVDHKKPTKKELVYLARSPSFCEFKPEYGSLGTRGRECNRTSNGLDGCSLMCCDRGYQTLIHKEQSDCDCKFHWCCRVQCKTCTQMVERNYCN